MYKQHFPEHPTQTSLQTSLGLSAFGGPLGQRKRNANKRHPYTTAACAAGVVTKTTDRDSLRYTYNGTRRVRQLALGCESN